MSSPPPATVLFRIAPSVRPGLALAGLFAWLLSFPMYGPLLFATAEAQAPALGLAFAAAHGTGLLLLHLLPLEAAAGRRQVAATGGALFALTALYAFAPLGPFLSGAVIALLGLIAAYLVLAWAHWFGSLDNPVIVLAVAMAGANVVLAAACLPFPLPPGPSLILLAALALAGALAVPAPAPEERPDTETPDASSPFSSRPVVVALGAFVIAVYFAGGIWYRVLFGQAFAVSPWVPALDQLVYAAGIVVLACAARRGQPGLLAVYSLSALGLGLLVAAAEPDLPGPVLASHILMLVGLASADLFFWLILWSLGVIYGSRRVFGLGLGSSLFVIAAAALLTQSTAGSEMAAPRAEIAGAALLFLAAPLIFRNVFPPLKPAAAPAGRNTPSGALPAGPAPAGPNADVRPVPENLTPTEQRVYLLLMQGATDAEIAARLFISRHTVKFHVRNILHKAGASNRRELRGRARQRPPEDKKTVG